MFKKIFLCIICLCLCACVSSRHTEQSVLEHQKQIDRTEESIRTRDRAINTCIRELAYIAGRSEEMGGDIDDIIRELDLYHAAVQRLLQATGYTAGKEQAIKKSSNMPDQYAIYYGCMYSGSALS